MRSGRERRRARWLTAALVAVLAVAVIMLSVLAVVRTERAAESIATTPRPIPSFTPSATVSPSSTTPPPLPETARAPGAEERFLSVGTGAMWRATAGACGGTEPLLERSADGGQTWQDVTPRYRGIGQILNVEAFGDTEAQIVARMGPGCELQALRTFTQGRFWEPYPDVLAGASYVDPAAPATVVIAGTPVTAPCPGPWGVRTGSGAVGIVCDGSAYQRIDDAWMPVSDGALAISADAVGITVAVSRAECDGVWIAPPAAGYCVPAAQPGPPIALAGGMLWLATGDVVRAAP